MPAKALRAVSVALQRRTATKPSANNGGGTRQATQKPMGRGKGDRVIGDRTASPSQKKRRGGDTLLSTKTATATGSQRQVARPQPAALLKHNTVALSPPLIVAPVRARQHVPPAASFSPFMSRGMPSAALSSLPTKADVTPTTETAEVAQKQRGARLLPSDAPNFTFAAAGHPFIVAPIQARQHLPQASASAVFRVPPPSCPQREPAATSSDPSIQKTTRSANSKYVSNTYNDDDANSARVHCASQKSQPLLTPPSASRPLPISLYSAAPSTAPREEAQQVQIAPSVLVVAAKTPTPALSAVPPPPPFTAVPIPTVVSENGVPLALTHGEHLSALVVGHHYATEISRSAFPSSSAEEVAAEDERPPVIVMGKMWYLLQRASAKMPPFAGWDGGGGEWGADSDDSNNWAGGTTGDFVDDGSSSHTISHLSQRSGGEYFRVWLRALLLAEDTWRGGGTERTRSAALEGAIGEAEEGADGRELLLDVFAPVRLNLPRWRWKRREKDGGGRRSPQRVVAGGTNGLVSPLLGDGLLRFTEESLVGKRSGDTRLQNDDFLARLHRRRFLGSLLPMISPVAAPMVPAVMEVRQSLTTNVTAQTAVGDTPAAVGEVSNNNNNNNSINTFSCSEVQQSSDLPPSSVSASFLRPAQCICLVAAAAVDAATLLLRAFEAVCPSYAYVAAASHGGRAQRQQQDIARSLSVPSPAVERNNSLVRAPPPRIAVMNASLVVFARKSLRPAVIASASPSSPSSPTSSFSDSLPSASPPPPSSAGYLRVTIPPLLWAASIRRQTDETLKEGHCRKETSDDDSESAKHNPQYHHHQHHQQQQWVLTRVSCLTARGDAFDAVPSAEVTRLLPMRPHICAVGIEEEAEDDWEVGIGGGFPRLRQLKKLHHSRGKPQQTSFAALMTQLPSLYCAVTWRWARGPPAASTQSPLQQKQEGSEEGDDGSLLPAVVAGVMEVPISFTVAAAAELFSQATGEGHLSVVACGKESNEKANVSGGEHADGDVLGDSANDSCGYADGHAVHVSYVAERASGAGARLRLLPASASVPRGIFPLLKPSNPIIGCGRAAPRDDGFFGGEVALTQAQGSGVWADAIESVGPFGRLHRRQRFDIYSYCLPPERKQPLPLSHRRGNPTATPTLLIGPPLRNASEFSVFFPGGGWHSSLPRFTRPSEFEKDTARGATNTIAAGSNEGGVGGVSAQHHQPFAMMPVGVAHERQQGEGRGEAIHGDDDSSVAAEAEEALANKARRSAFVGATVRRCLSNDALDVAFLAALVRRALRSRRDHDDASFSPDCESSADSESEAMRCVRLLEAEDEVACSAAHSNETSDGGLPLPLSLPPQKKRNGTKASKQRATSLSPTSASPRPPPASSQCTELAGKNAGPQEPSAAVAGGCPLQQWILRHSRAPPIALRTSYAVEVIFDTDSSNGTDVIGDDDSNATSSIINGSSSSPTSSCGASAFPKEVPRAVTTAYTATSSEEVSTRKWTVLPQHSDVTFGGEFVGSSASPNSDGLEGGGAYTFIRPPPNQQRRFPFAFAPPAVRLRDTPVAVQRLVAPLPAYEPYLAPIGPPPEVCALPLADAEAWQREFFAERRQRVARLFETSSTMATTTTMMMPSAEGGWAYPRRSSKNILPAVDHLFFLAGAHSAASMAAFRCAATGRMLHVAASAAATHLADDAENRNLFLGSLSSSSFASSSSSPSSASITAISQSRTRADSDSYDCGAEESDSEEERSGGVVPNRLQNKQSSTSEDAAVGGPPAATLLFWTLAMAAERRHAIEASNIKTTNNTLNQSSGTPDSNSSSSSCVPPMSLTSAYWAPLAALLADGERPGGGSVQHGLAAAYCLRAIVLQTAATANGSGRGLFEKQTVNVTVSPSLAAAAQAAERGEGEGQGVYDDDHADTVAVRCVTKRRAVIGHDLAERVASLRTASSASMGGDSAATLFSGTKKEETPSAARRLAAKRHHQAEKRARSATAEPSSSDLPPTSPMQQLRVPPHIFEASASGQWRLTGTYVIYGRQAFVQLWAPLDYTPRDHVLQ